MKDRLMSLIFLAVVVTAAGLALANLGWPALRLSLLWWVTR